MPFEVLTAATKKGTVAWVVRQCPREPGISEEDIAFIFRVIESPAFRRKISPSSSG
jgi:hypothetical protein